MQIVSHGPVFKPVFWENKKIIFYALRGLDKLGRFSAMFDTETVFDFLLVFFSAHQAPSEKS